MNQILMLKQEEHISHLNDGPTHPFDFTVDSNGYIENNVETMTTVSCASQKTTITTKNVICDQ
jgi:hypothetical protein